MGKVVAATAGVAEMKSLTVVLLLLTARPVDAQPYSREMVVAHNRVRARIGVPPLEWSQRLADVAQQWANELAASGKFAHRPKGKYGENLFEIRGAHATPAEVVTAWAGEAKDYDAATNMCRPGQVCGHYTQLVWRNTKQVGCGVAQRGSRQAWVCNYDPPGNWVGERPY